ncbi:MAG: Rrf2 family transcriptional regulator [Gammaproteobacteria bacterium SHHR-1]|uniref:Rrf2 family transcriptional regulator n=1 Tax=Magnetovirga frankeli TaxID=947516 RepID=UPI0012939EEA|nr:Rrf2 family transcriptional regulator [gamma proteobacterium SS-5]
MRLSTKGRYAITSMLDLALKGADEPVTLSEIAHNQGISLSYLEQLFSSLRSKGLVKGVRGPGGGYYLGRDLNDISIADIICAVDEWVDMTQKRRKGSTPLHAFHSPSQGLWERLSTDIYDFLDQITLADLTRDQNHFLLDTRKAA